MKYLNKIIGLTKNTVNLLFYYLHIVANTLFTVKCFLTDSQIRSLSIHSNQLLVFIFSVTVLAACLYTYFFVCLLVHLLTKFIEV